MAYWYGIDTSSSLTDQQIGFFAVLLLRYIDEKMPDLLDEGIKVPPMRKRAQQ
jgi:hypothetical protein